MKEYHWTSTGKRGNEGLRPQKLFETLPLKH